MQLTAQAKAEVIQKYQREAGDTGSSEVQIALLTSRITQLTDHLKIHKKDKHTRFGLLKMVSLRRKLLDYLKRTNLDRYKQLLEQLGLRR
jgi:small subunit ribosomal protein S15